MVLRTLQAPVQDQPADLSSGSVLRVSMTETEVKEGADGPDGHRGVKDFLWRHTALQIH